MKFFLALVSLFVCFLAVQGNVSVALYYWQGDEINSSSSKSFDEWTGKTLLEAMKQAAEEDPDNFAFLTDDDGFVTKLGSTANGDDGKLVWKLYVTQRQPDADDTPNRKHISTLPLDKIIVDPLMFYLFWFRTY